MYHLDVHWLRSGVPSRGWLLAPRTMFVPLIPSLVGLLPEPRFRVSLSSLCDTVPRSKRSILPVSPVGLVDQPVKTASRLAAQDRVVVSLYTVMRGAVFPANCRPERNSGKNSRGEGRAPAFEPSRLNRVPRTGPRIILTPCSLERKRSFYPDRCCGSFDPFRVSLLRVSCSACSLGTF